MHFDALEALPAPVDGLLKTDCNDDDNDDDDNDDDVMMVTMTMTMTMMVMNYGHEDIGDDVMILVMTS